MSAGNCTAALVDAWPAWRQALGQQGWSAALVGLAQGSVGLLCIARGRASWPAGGRGAAWVGGGAALLMIALTSWLAIDRLLVLVMRDLAHAQGWYAQRRVWQVLVLALGGGVALVAVLRARGLLANADAASRWAAAGVTLVTLVALLRLVSLHATDLWLQARLAGLSAGRWVEALGLCMTVAGAVRTWPVNGR